MANQTPMANDARLKGQLLRQLGFLERSAIAYDQGHKDEAIRMAAVMRTLFCNSKKSAGLVFQLHGKKIFLNSTCPRFDVEPLQFCGLVDFVFGRGQTEGEAVAALDGSNKPTVITLWSVNSDTFQPQNPRLVSPTVHIMLATGQSVGLATVTDSSLRLALEVTRIDEIQRRTHLGEPALSHMQVKRRSL